MEAKRICVIGCSGAGKTTFARRCAELGYAVLELDSVFHQAGWTTLPADEARRRVDAFTRTHERWVVDGNYLVLRDLLWSRADAVVWLDPERTTTFARVVRRTLRRFLRREVLWSGNRERLSEVLSLDPERSVVSWAWAHHPHYRREYLREMERRPDLRWVRLRSPGAVDALFARSLTGLVLEPTPLRYAGLE